MSKGAENYLETSVFCQDATAIPSHKGNLDLARKRKIIIVFGHWFPMGYKEEMYKMIIQNLAPFDLSYFMVLQMLFIL